MSVQTTERPIEADLAVPDVSLPPLPPAWRSLPRAFLDTARANWSKEGMSDSTGVSLTFGSALVRALALSRALAREIGPEPYVGLMVPPSVPAAIANIALLMLGKIPVNLNYSSSQTVIDAAVDQAGIRHVVTSRKVIEKVHLTPKGTLVYLEDMPPRVGKLDKAWAAMVGKLVPQAMLGSFLPGLKGEKLDATATVMFTSGSTGEPEGGGAHARQRPLERPPDAASARARPPRRGGAGDPAVLPLVRLYGQHLDHPPAGQARRSTTPTRSTIKIIGDLCREAQSDPDRRLADLRPPLHPAQARAIRHALPPPARGGEAPADETADEIREKIHLEPLEGYGTTEMSPVAAVNVPFEITLPDGRKVPGNRPGTVGRPLPGTAVKTTDPETGADLPRGSEGMIWVKGPQIMKGYLNRADATAKVLKDGWYESGDLGYLDPDGFLKITGRLSRFSKIAGEMVPHLGVESALMEAAGVDDTALAVTAVPDDKRQERLVVVHAKLPISPAEIVKKLLAAGLPKLWVPAAEDFLQVEAVPRLGPGGKLDLRRLKEIAMEGAKRD